MGVATSLSTYVRVGLFHLAMTEVTILACVIGGVVCIVDTFNVSLGLSATYTGHCIQWRAKRWEAYTEIR